MYAIIHSKLNNYSTLSIIRVMVERRVNVESKLYTLLSHEQKLKIIYL
jgi:hypothetical protein